MIEPAGSPGTAALEAAREGLARAALVLCDIDGCLLESERACAGAARFVKRMGDRLRLVTNNSTDIAATLQARLAAAGLEVPAHHLFLAGEQAVAHLARQYAGTRALVVGTARIKARVEEAGLSLAGHGPEVALLCNDPDLRVDDLQRLVEAAWRGVPVVVANPDRWRPDGNGCPQIETGALLAALSTVVQRARITVIGKPAPGIFRAALGEVDPRRAVMIGDNHETDIAGAEALGMTGLLIGRSRRAIVLNVGELCPAVNDHPVPALASRRRVTVPSAGGGAGWVDVTSDETGC